MIMPGSSLLRTRSKISCKALSAANRIYSEKLEALSITTGAVLDLHFCNWNLVVATSTGCINVYRAFFDNGRPSMRLFRILRVADPNVVVTSISLPSNPEEDHRLAFTTDAGGVYLLSTEGI